MGETYETDGPRCPLCGYLERDLEAYHYDEDTCELTCSSCGKDYGVHVYTSTSWTCRALTTGGEGQ